MRIVADAFWLPKQGNSAEEYEDAVLPLGHVEGSLSKFRCAVADGATESSFAGLWAKIIVRAYYSGRLESRPVPDCIDTLQKVWKRIVSRKNLPWYAELKLISGAFSSLVGLTVLDSTGNDSGDWKCIAVGDSCLFQIRNNELITSLPIESSEQFSSRPVLLSTNPSSNEGVFNQCVERIGKWHIGDKFYLMTDALACWFLRLWYLTESDPIEFLESINTNEEFAALVASQRSDRFHGVPMLRNDDVTVVKCSILEH